MTSYKEIKNMLFLLNKKQINEQEVFLLEYINDIFKNNVFDSFEED